MHVQWAVCISAFISHHDYFLLAGDLNYTSVLLDQELIAHHYLFCCCCCSSSWSDLFKKASGSVVSNQIRVKFGRNVLQVNTHRLTESDFWFDGIVSRRRPWRRFKQKSAANWWVHMQRLPGAYAAASASSSSVVYIRASWVLALINSDGILKWTSACCSVKRLSVSEILAQNHIWTARSETRPLT